MTGHRDILDLRAGDLMLRIGAQGGVILDFRHGGRALMRPAAEGAGPGDSACFPLVPWGNRVRGNRLVHGGATYRLTPNVPPEPLHLHGAGWQSVWTVESAGTSSAQLCHHHDGRDLPHHYLARQVFELDQNRLRMTLSVTNTGDRALPFGLGWHPFFPAGGVLRAPATGIWTEGPDHLPAIRSPVRDDLDFAAPRPLPPRRINTAFDGWTGDARIDWPAQDLSLTISADPVFRHYQLYQPAAGSFFTFEPMSHLSGAMSLPDPGGLTPLAPGETLAGTIILTPGAGVIAGDPS